MLERKQVGIDAKGEPIMADYVLDGNLYFKVVENLQDIVGNDNLMPAALQNLTPKHTLSDHNSEEGPNKRQHGVIRELQRT